MNWQPIETAPRDGRSLLCCGHGGEYNPETMAFGGKLWYWPADGDAPTIQPTHWMPLPPPPTAEQAAAPTIEEWRL